MVFLKGQSGSPENNIDKEILNEIFGKQIFSIHIIFETLMHLKVFLFVLEST